jgi:EAL domain-containing protein (putative c-di-GMP-specific phosphodiesterase class I)
VVSVSVNVSGRQLDDDMIVEHIRSALEESGLASSALTHLGLVTLAEGVETASEMDILRADHVDEAQGYLFARPLEPEQFESQVLASPGMDRAVLHSGG